ncbi:hypothetical protein V5P93_000163 [Actinokineospora auranticolor]|uniref:hypothetical protein n=1 Tax=Actinokineospora auranticolor TaxID=155976 RepID=UPI0011B0E953|nr:hypothetical protein [Actinokineospora auranticolor]
MDDQGESALGPLVTRAAVLKRAYSWVDENVPHNGREWWSNEFGCYRTDSAGYLAMAWQLPESVAGIEAVAEVSDPIEKAMLLPGDVLLRREGTPVTRHAAIFEDWVETASRMSFWGLEQRTGLGAVRRRIRYPYENSSTRYEPYRYRNIL